MPAKRSLNPKDLSFPKILDESDDWLPLLIESIKRLFLRKEPILQPFRNVFKYVYYHHSISETRWKQS